MATVLKGGVVLSNGYDLSCHLQELNESAETDLLDATALCTTGGRSYAPGLTRRNISGEAFWNASATDEAKNIDALFKQALGSQSEYHRLTVGMQGAAFGAQANFYLADQSKGGASLKIGDLIMVSFEAQAGAKSGRLGYQEGVWLIYGDLSGNGTQIQSAAYDNGKPTTGYLVRIHNAGNSPTVTYQFEHSTNGTTWVSLFNSTGGGAVPANEVAEFYSNSAAVSRYVRLVVNSSEGASRIGAAYSPGI